MENENELICDLVNWAWSKSDNDVLQRLQSNRQLYGQYEPLALLGIIQAVRAALWQHVYPIVNGQAYAQHRERMRLQEIYRNDAAE